MFKGLDAVSCGLSRRHSPQTSHLALAQILFLDYCSSESAFDKCESAVCMRRHGGLCMGHAAAAAGGWRPCAMLRDVSSILRTPGVLQRTWFSCSMLSMLVLDYACAITPVQACEHISWLVAPCLVPGSPRHTLLAANQGLLHIVTLHCELNPCAQRGRPPSTMLHLVCADDKMSAYEVFKLCGVTQRAYEEFLKPTLLVRPLPGCDACISDRDLGCGSGSRLRFTGGWE